MLADGCCERCELRMKGCRETELYSHEGNSKEAVSPKRFKSQICTCCLGLLQPTFWPRILQSVRSELENNRYDCERFACGLSLPVSTALREHSLRLYLQQNDSDWKSDNVVPLKQAWKWSFGAYLAEIMQITLDSGSVCPFLVTLHMSYERDTEELETLTKMLPEVFKKRREQRRKFRGEMFTKANVDNILQDVDVNTFKNNFDCPPKSPSDILVCSRLEFTHSSLYIGGRYIKMSRELPQTPWIVDGKRIMDNSIQEIIFQPLVEFFGISSPLQNDDIKFISSGREDVDVRCLGKGRPFAVEIVNPMITKISHEKLREIEKAMSNNDLLKIIHLQIIDRESLHLLKMGENSKTKTYEALCIKLSDTLSDKANVSNSSATRNSSLDDNITPISVLNDDIATMNSYSNVPGTNEILIQQKTPLRVLHRRPLLTRSRKIFFMKGSCIKDQPNMFTLELTTDAGTYIKEFIHGDFGRTEPNLSQILGFKVDILALDVKSINLDWP